MSKILGKLVLPAKNSDPSSPITGQLYYNRVTGKLLIYNGVAAAWDSLFVLPSLTSGSVLFSNGTTISQDNSKLFWDNTNKKLTVGAGASADTQPIFYWNGSTDYGKTASGTIIGQETVVVPNTTGATVAGSRSSMFKVNHSTGGIYMEGGGPSIYQRVKRESTSGFAFSLFQLGAEKTQSGNSYVSDLLGTIGAFGLFNGGTTLPSLNYLFIDFRTTNTWDGSKIKFNSTGIAVNRTSQNGADALIDLTSETAARVGLLMRGHASQSGNYIDVKNSSDVTLFSVSSAGATSTPTLTATSRINMPQNARYGLGAIYNISTGDIFGIEQISVSEFAGGSMLRMFTSNNAGCAGMSFGKYTSATAFTDWFTLRNTTGNAGFGDNNPNTNLVVRRDQNAATYAAIRNNTSGTAAYAGLFVGNAADTASVGTVALSAEYTTSGMLVANTGGLFSSMSNGLNIGTNQNAQVSIWSNNLQRMTVLAGGNVGIGQTTPTAYLHIKSGTATAGTAPIKLTSGTLNSTPEAGAVEWDGTNLYITRTDGTRKTIAFV